MPIRCACGGTHVCRRTRVSSWAPGWDGAGRPAMCCNYSGTWVTPEVNITLFHTGGGRHQSLQVPTRGPSWTQNQESPRDQNKDPKVRHSSSAKGRAAVSAEAPVWNRADVVLTGTPVQTAVEHRGLPAVSGGKAGWFSRSGHGWPGPPKANRSLPVQPSPSAPGCFPEGVEN